MTRGAPDKRDAVKKRSPTDSVTMTTMTTVAAATATTSARAPQPRMARARRNSGEGYALCPSPSASVLRPILVSTLGTQIPASDYRLASRAGDANDDDFIIQYLLIFLADSAQAWLEYLQSDFIYSWSDLCRIFIGNFQGTYT